MRRISPRQLRSRVRLTEMNSERSPPLEQLKLLDLPASVAIPLDQEQRQTLIVLMAEAIRTVYKAQKGHEHEEPQNQT